MCLLRIPPAANSGKSRAAHGGCCITETSAVKQMHALCCQFTQHQPRPRQLEGPVTIYQPQSPSTPIRAVLCAQAGQQSPVVVPAGKVLDPGVCVSMR